MATIPVDEATAVLNGRTYTHFIQGDSIEITPVNPLSEQVNGAGGSVNINKRSDAGVHDVVMRVMQYSPDDIALNSIRNSGKLVVINGTVKRDFVRDGVDGSELWLLENGSISTQPGRVYNNETDNPTVEYTIRFRNATRSI